MRILVVEDDKTLRLASRGLLENLGHVVDESDNGDDALEMLIGDPEIRIVILDLGLPPHVHRPEGGLSFLRSVRALGLPVKVIVASSQAQQEALLDCVECGAFDILQKPFDLRALEQSLKRAALFSDAERRLRETGQKFPVLIVADSSSEGGIKAAREEVIERLVRATLSDTEHNVSETARRLSLTREQVYYYLKKFGISRPEPLD
ncbi:CheY FOG, CheY-like receiver [Burkholderiales bacterium]|jgi:DNA-binding NtrC family response regulator